MYTHMYILQSTKYSHNVHVYVHYCIHIQLYICVEEKIVLARRRSLDDVLSHAIA